jgi:protein SCO1/2
MLVKIVIAVAFVIGLVVSYQMSKPATVSSATIAQSSLNDAHPSGTDYMQWYPMARKIVDFTLTNHHNQPMTNADLKGQWTLAFVGYTFCPDICPTTLAALNQAYPKILASADQQPIKVWFLSVDPKRDTIERLAEYVGFFNPEFIGATAEHKQLYPLVRSMGMMYSMSQSTDDPNYLVDHSGSVVVINPLGQVIGRFKPQHAPGQIAMSDTAQIIADMPKVIAYRRAE